MERTMSRIARCAAGAALAAGLVLSVGLLARADEASHERALVEAKDLDRRTVTLAGHTYRVGSQTQLIGLDGEPITLRDLRAGAHQDGSISSDTADTVEFELQPASDVLDSLRVVDMMPR